MQIFLSYSHANSDKAGYIHDQLEREQFTVWWYQENTKGDDFARQLTVWIRTSNTVVVLLSRKSVGSIWVKREVLFAEAYQRRILPVYLDSKQVLLAEEENSLLILVINMDRINAYDGHDPIPELVRVLREQTSQQEAQVPQPQPDPPMKGRAFPKLAAHIQRKLMTGSGKAEPLLPPQPSPAQAHITIELPGSAAEFTADLQTAFVQVLAMLANLQPEQIAVVSVREGSIKLTLALPESTARWLIALHEMQAPLISFLGATGVSELTILPQSAPGLGPLDRLREWLGVLNMPGRLVGVGALLVVLLIALALGDVFRPAQPAEIALCGNLSLTTATCSSGAPIALFQGEVPDNTLSIPETDIPLLLAPRGGGLLTPSTRVRWTAARGATSYRVSLQREGAEIWSATVSDTTELLYPPAGAPPLERGATYRFGISTGDGRAENATGIGFTVLGEGEAEPIQAEEQRIRAQGLDDPAARVLVANLYAGKQLYGEALGLLEPPATTATQPAVELLRGNIYITIDLPELALQSYQRALALLQAEGDQQAVALLQARIDAVQRKIGT